MKTTKLEKNILQFIDKHLDVLFIIAISIIALALRIIFKDISSKDYIDYTKKWMLEIEQNGGLLALKNIIGNYNQPYLFLLAILTYLPMNSLYSIKMLSIMFDFGLAFSAYSLVSTLTFGKKEGKIVSVLTYAIVLMLPTVVLNGAAWGQCDSIYAMFMLLSLNYLFKNKYTKSFIFLGCAFAFKLQFIFILPLYLILYFKERKFSIINFLLIPLVNLILCLPSIIVGHPLLHCFSVYFEQVGYYKQTTMNMANMYIYLPDKYNYMAAIGVGILLLIFALLMYLTLKNKKGMSKENIITLGLLSICLCVFFLPNMHDRYLFVADVLCVVWYLVNKRDLFIPIGINIISLCCYMPFLFNYNKSIIYPFLPILFFIIIIRLIWIYFNSLKNS